MNKQLLFNNNIKQVHAPVDLNTAAITGARIPLAKGEKIAVVGQLGTSTAATLIYSFQQHTAATGGTSKALEISNKYYHKAGAATVFTEVEPTVDASTVDLSSVFAADGGLVVFEINGDDIDANNLFTHVSVDIADSAAAKLGAHSYLVMNAEYCPAYAEAL